MSAPRARRQEPRFRRQAIAAAARRAAARVLRSSAAGRETGHGAAARAGGRRGVARVGCAGLRYRLAPRGCGQGKRLLLLRTHTPHRLPVPPRERTGPLLLLPADLERLAALATAGDGPSNGALRVCEPVYPIAMLARLGRGAAHRSARRLRWHAPARAQDSRAAGNQPASRADSARHGLPPANRLRLGGQQPRAPRRVQRRCRGPHPLHLRGVRRLGRGINAGSAAVSR